MYHELIVAAPLRTLYDTYLEGCRAHGWSDNCLAYDVGESATFLPDEVLYPYDDDDDDNDVDYEAIGDAIIGRLTEAGLIEKGA